MIIHCAVEAVKLFGKNCISKFVDLYLSTPSPQASHNFVPSDVETLSKCFHQKGRGASAEVVTATLTSLSSWTGQASSFCKQKSSEIDTSESADIHVRCVLKTNLGCARCK